VNLVLDKRQENKEQQKMGISSHGCDLRKQRAPVKWLPRTQV
jgi:hypothetical protein